MPPVDAPTRPRRHLRGRRLRQEPDRRSVEQQPRRDLYWAVHNDGAAGTAGPVWPRSAARPTDDHLNIKALQSDAAGRVFAVVKTGLDRTGTSRSRSAGCAASKPSAGSWTSPPSERAPTATPALSWRSTSQTRRCTSSPPAHGRRLQRRRVGHHLREGRLDGHPRFPRGWETPIIRDTDSHDLNDVTLSKQSVTASSGLVVLASNPATQRYWHADIALGGGTPTPTPTPTPEPRHEQHAGLRPAAQRR